MSRARHWESLYGREESTELGWYQAEPEISLRLLREAGIEPGQRVMTSGADPRASSIA